MKATGANSSKRSAAGLESREQSSRESSPVRESESRLTSTDRKVALNRTQTLLSSYSHIPVPARLACKQRSDAKPAQKLPFFVMENISYHSAVRAEDSQHL